jgi:hypothetical protein
MTTAQKKCIAKAIKDCGDIDDRICRLVESDLFEDFDLDDLEDLVSTVDDLDYADFSYSCDY